VVRCWHGYLSEARCRFAYGPADATATHYLLLQQFQIGFTRMVLLFWCRLTQVVLEKWPLNECSSSSSSSSSSEAGCKLLYSFLPLLEQGLVCELSAGCCVVGSVSH